MNTLDKVTEIVREKVDKLKYYTDKTVVNPSAITDLKFFEDLLQELETIEYSLHDDCKTDDDVENAKTEGFVDCKDQVIEVLKRTDLKTRGDLMKAVEEIQESES